MLKIHVLLIFVAIIYPIACSNEEYPGNLEEQWNAIIEEIGENDLTLQDRVNLNLFQNVMSFIFKYFSNDEINSKNIEKREVNEADYLDISENLEWTIDSHENETYYINWTVDSEELQLLLEEIMAELKELPEDVEIFQTRKGNNNNLRFFQYITQAWDTLQKFRQTFKQILEKSRGIAHVNESYRKIILRNMNPSLFCKSCEVGVNFIVGLRRTFNSEILSILQKYGAKFLCKVFMTEEFCNGIVDLHFDWFTYMIDNHPNISSAKICGISAQAMGCRVPDYDYNAWNIQIPKPSRNYNEIEFDYTPENFLGLIHISDIHYDAKYKEGTEIDCRDPVCCSSNKSHSYSGEYSGKWGGYKKCDTPLIAVQELFQFLSERLDVTNFVYFTGDIISHRIWDTSIEENTKSFKIINELFVNTYIKKGIMVYPTLGNHETSPLNSYAPANVDPRFSTQWLYDLAAETWYWLPEDAKTTIRKGGYYTVKHGKGFRIIVLNSNVAYTYNWWLIWEDKDPLNQLQWLTNVLQYAERNNEVVHILSHIPPGEKDTYMKWGAEYTKIINRFAHIITGQFCGHTHQAELHYFYKNPDIYETPTNIMYNGGSFTSYRGNNPNIKLYLLNSRSFDVQNYQDWMFNLTHANLGKDLLFYRYFSFTEGFELESMSLENMGEVPRKMTKDKKLLTRYKFIKNKSADLSDVNTNDVSNMMTLCKMVTSNFGDKRMCYEFMYEYAMQQNE